MELIVRSKANGLSSIIVTVLENFNLFDPADRKEILKRIITAMAKQAEDEQKKRHRRTKAELAAAAAATKKAEEDHGTSRIT